MRDCTASPKWLGIVGASKTKRYVSLYKFIAFSIAIKEKKND